MKLTTRDARGISIGIEFVVSVLLGLAAGFWLDRHFATTPWCTLAGIVLGFTAGLRSLIQWTRDAARRDEAAAADPPSTAPPSKDSPRAPSDPSG